jgi:VCBS repeat-containing protein
MATQKAIESVYWKHRIWPKENKTAKPTLEELLPDSTLNKKVISDLRKSAALKSFWQTLITPEQVQTEIKRMVKESKDQATLSEIFSALKNDPFLIAEGLVHPLLVEQKIRKLYSYDQRFHGALRKQAQADLNQFKISKSWKGLSGIYLETTWVQSDDGNPNDAETFYLTTEEWEQFQNKLRQIFTAVTQNQESLRAGSFSSIHENENQFFAITILEQSENQIRLGTVHWNKAPFDEWWRETETSITPEMNEESNEYNFDLPAFKNMGCSTDSWTPMAEPPEPNVPIAREWHVAVWTGTEMIVWSGSGSVEPFTKTGGRYYPATNTWLPTSLLNAPPGRDLATAVWTGTEMIVWGGVDTSQAFRSGGRYDPVTDAWSPTSLTDAPEERLFHTAVWTGNEMIIWGGRYGPTFNNGAKYNPSTDSWVAVSLDGAPTGRYEHTAVWTGNKMIIWGGAGQNTGGIYDPELDIWQNTTLTNAPENRGAHNAVWTGNEMIIWGGYHSGNYLNSGGKYDPSSDTWFEVSINNSPIGRTKFSSIWTGDEMIVWGGYTGSTVENSGGRYNPTTDQWLATSLINAPEKRRAHTAVLTGSTMIVWGGLRNRATGGIYCATLNSIPISVDDSYSAVEDTILTISSPGVLFNDTDPNFDALTAFLTEGPLNGSLTLDSNGSFEYTPSANFNGQDLFTYQAFDGIAYSNPSTVSLNVEPMNDAPIANNESYSVQEDSPINISAPGILSNDTDIENDTLSALLISEPSNGQLNLNSNGSFNYVPQENFNGTDAFTYNATDGSLPSNPATVSITVNPMNDAPVAGNDSYSTQEDTILNITPPGVLGNDSDVEGDSLEAILVSGPNHGNLFLDEDGSFVYVPVGNFNGTDSFLYHVNDGTIDSNDASVNITVVPVNDAPSAVNDAFSTAEDSVLTITTPGVLSNDSDVESNPLNAVLDSSPDHGELTLNPDGSFIYVPNPNFNGPDFFSYHANDGNLDSNIATVSINVIPINDSPVAMDDAAIVDQNSIDNPIDVLSNDIDADGDSLTIIAVTQGANGAVSISNDGSGLTFTPNQGFTGNDSFTYTIDDGNGGSDIGTVAVTVTFPSCLFCDDFNDGILNPNWNYIKPAWTEPSDELIGIPANKKAIAVATPIFTGCQNCYVEASMKSAGGTLNKVWLLAWYIDKKNRMELLMKEEGDRWVLKQKAEGRVVAKAKGIKTIDPDTSYIVRMLFDGTSFQVFINDLLTPLFTLTPAVAVPVGTVGFQIKNTMGSFDYIVVNN